MGNLVRKPTELLVNTVDVSGNAFDKTIEALSDGSGVLIKNYGKLLSAEASWAGVAKDVLKATPVAGVKYAAVVNIKPQCCDGCNDLPVMASVTLGKKERLAGQVGMTKNVSYSRRSYAGKLTKLLGSCSGGFLSTNDQAAITTNIVTTLQGDKYPYFYAGETVVVDVTDANAAIELDVTANGTLTAVDDTTLAGVITKINAVGTMYAWSVDVDGTAATLYIVPTGNWNVTTSGHNGNVADSTTYVNAIGIISDSVKYQLTVGIDPEDGALLSENPNAAYPYLSGEDVARRFPILAEHQGSLPIIPVSTGTYYKYGFKLTHQAYGLEGMNHMDYYEEFVYAYVLNSGSNISNWDAALKAGGFTINGAFPYTIATTTITGNATSDGVVNCEVTFFDGSTIVLSADIADTTTAANIAAQLAAEWDTGSLAVTANSADVILTDSTRGIKKVVWTETVATTSFGTVAYS